MWEHGIGTTLLASAAAIALLAPQAAGSSTATWDFWFKNQHQTETVSMSAGTHNGEFAGECRNGTITGQLWHDRTWPAANEKVGDPFTIRCSQGNTRVSYKLSGGENFFTFNGPGDVSSHVWGYLN